MESKMNHMHYSSGVAISGKLIQVSSISFL